MNELDDLYQEGYLSDRSIEQLRADLNAKLEEKSEFKKDRLYSALLERELLKITVGLTCI